MSVAGNLSDLTLTELLQTIALSRKSGTLEICADPGVAWLGLREGGIVRVALSDADLARESVLKSAGLRSDSPSDEIEACLWEAAVSAILGLFDWREGEFTFSPDEDPFEVWRGPEGLTLPTSLSPEFLALEGARLEDEAEEAAERVPRETPPPSIVEPSPNPPQSVVGEPADPAPELELEPEPQPERVVVDPAPREPGPRVAEPDSRPAEPELRSDHPERPPVQRERRVEPDRGGLEAAPERSTAPVDRAPSPSAVATREPVGILIAVDPELPLLEVIKAQLAPTGVRVHIFQRPEDGLERIKQYLIRGELPVVLIGHALPPPGWRAFTQRVRRMVPKIRVLLLRAPGSEPLTERGPRPDAVLRRYDLVREDSKRLIEYIRAGAAPWAGGGGDPA